eukprot:g1809.t1
MITTTHTSCLWPCVRGPRVYSSRSLSRVAQRRFLSYATLEVGEDFIQEMRTVTMKLHKAPRDKDAPSFSSSEYTREGFLRHLVEARVVYRAFEEIINSNENYAQFRDSGLDRGDALDVDIEWLASKYDLEIPMANSEGPGETYAKFIREVACDNEGQFLCHFYNYYLAHTAGGRMIGKKVADTVLNGIFDELAYYQYDADLKTLVTNLKSNVNTFAASLSRSEKDNCLEETPTAFKYGGALLRTLFD